MFPPSCILCGDPISAKAAGLCAACRRKFHRERDILCPICGRKAASCRCAFSHLNGEVFPGVSAAVSRFYNPNHASKTGEMTRSLILRCKREGRRDIAQVLSAELAIRVAGLLRTVGEERRGWIVTYVPRTSENLLKYGWDQGEMLAFELAWRLECPFRPTLFRHSGEIQKNLSSEERYVNAKSGLAPRKKSVVRGGKYILVDDVLTTGATMAVAVKLLYECGASMVLPTAVAKTMSRKKSDE